MKPKFKNVTRLFIISTIILSIIISFAGCGKKSHPSADSRDYTLYECNGRVITLQTKIEIDKEGEYFGKIQGNIFTVVTDPLTMYDVNDNKLAHAGDTYHFINQDSHGIYIGRELMYEMVGKFEWMGQEYEIYDYDENYIGKLKFSPGNFNGMLTDAKGNIVAEYDSLFGFKDFEVIIYDNCEIDEVSVLMMFGSYYSDYHYDAEQ